MRSPCGRDHFKALELANPMIDMNHQITNGQRLGLREKVLSFAAFFCSADQPVAQNILF